MMTNVLQEVVWAMGNARAQHTLFIFTPEDSVITFWD